jgi:hypothetical protein
MDEREIPTVHTVDLNLSHTNPFQYLHQNVRPQLDLILFSDINEYEETTSGALLV